MERKNPGRYEVPSSTDLVRLLSYAGGPIQYAKLSDVRITRVMRTGNNVSKKEYSVDLDDLQNRTDGELELCPGDAIVIDNTAWLTVRDVFSVLTTTAVITVAVAQVINLMRR